MAVKKLLIANRGEIACRIIKTARKLGISTVAVYSDSDKSALHVTMADEAFYIGASPATQSYLNQKRLLGAIRSSGADSVHPGYGFLSEKADFAELMHKNGITFIGPSHHAIREMGDKIRAKKIAQEASVNVIPGYMGAIKSDKEALIIAAKIGYPIILKAAAGGGGKGMRVVRNKEEMQQAFSSTRNEAKNNFSDSRTFIEKFIDSPRHIEIQLLGDQYGNYVCLGERDCSIQRHNQKVIEEAPSAILSEKMRRKMYEQSIALAKKVGYYSVGTVEYIVAPDKKFYFLEMNTRLQVEHGVTELITGIDLVEQMIKVANGEKLSFKQKDIVFNGWAIESRVYAEDPTCGFLPSAGRITTYKEPALYPGVRIDSGVYEGGEVSMFYDPMIAKLCTHASTRDYAIHLMNDALGQYVIRGIAHNMSFLQAIINTQRFLSNDISTKFIEDEYKGGFTGAVLSDEESAVMLCTAVYIYIKSMNRAMIREPLRFISRALGTRWIVRMNDRNYPIVVRAADEGFKISFENTRFYIFSKWPLGDKLFQCSINGQNYSLQIEYIQRALHLTYKGSKVQVSIFSPRVAELTKYMKSFDTIEDQKHLLANLSGVVVDIKTKVGDEVVKNQPLLILESMKMENVLLSPVDGKIIKINAVKGQSCSVGDLLIEIEPQVRAAS